MAKKKKFSKSLTFGLSILSLVCGIVVGAIGSVAYSLIDVKSDEKKKESLIGVTYDEFQVHFLELGNIYAGDSIYVKAGENDILIDAGSRSSSTNTIKNYVNNYCEDGKLEYVIATHAHQDHIAAFVGDNGILKSYEIGTLIDFPLSNSTSQVYKDYKSARDYIISKGTTHYTALDCWNNEGEAKREFTLGDNMKMHILYTKHYEEKTSDENDYSVCVLFEYGSTKFLLTGDLESKGEASLVEHNRDLIKDCDVFKAGHHGSKTSSTDTLLDIVKPDYSVVTCVCGSTEYTSNNDNTFPTQAYIDRISKHTDQVFVTSLCLDYKKGEYKSMNGNVIASSDGSSVAIACSNNSTLLKDTEWFKNNRNCPESWK